MDRNVRIAKELVRIAKSLVAGDDENEKALKDFNTKCFKEFIDKKLNANGTTVTGDYMDSIDINGKKVEVQMNTFSKNNKAEFKYYVDVDGKSFDQVIEADVSVPFKAQNTYEFEFDSDDNAKKFLNEYKDSITRSLGTAQGIDKAFKKAVEALA